MIDMPPYYFHYLRFFARYATLYYVDIFAAVAAMLSIDITPCRCHFRY